MLQLIDEDGRAMDDGTEPAAKSQLTWNAEAGKIRGLNAIYKRAAVLTGMGTTKLASLLDRYLESNGEVVEVGDNTTRGRASPGCVQYSPGLAGPGGLEGKLGSAAGAERLATSSVDCLCIGGMVCGGVLGGMVAADAEVADGQLDMDVQIAAAELGGDDHAAEPAAEAAE